MYLVDTSVWINHFRKQDPALTDSLNQGLVHTHPFIIGELALGSLSRRADVLRDLANLSAATIADDDEVLEMIDSRALYAKGIGYVDAHLLASIFISKGLVLWTNDKRLHAVAAELGLARSS